MPKLSAGSYKVAMAILVAVLFALQRAIVAYASGSTRQILGYAISLAFCAAVVELGAPVLGRSLLDRRPSRGGPGALKAYVALTLILLINAFSKELAVVFVFLPRPFPAIPLAIFICWWVGVVWWLLRRGYSSGLLVASLVGLVAGTRLLVMRLWPFDHLDGDMLPTINRALEALAAGKFPYANYPPTMPYLPGTFLAYAPAKAFGLDLRVVNIAFDVLTVVAAIYLAPRIASRSRPAGDGREAPGPTLGQLLLPCFMLHPVWVQYAVNTQFSPGLFFAALLGFAVLLGGFRVQALALGIAVGTNQMLGACGPILLGYWAGRCGPRRAAGLALLAGAAFLAIIVPFLFWEPRQFVEIAFLSRAKFGDHLMAGRLTLLPLASKFVPAAGPICSAIVLAIASWVAWRARRPTTAVAAMAAGLCAALLFQPVSFTHYYMPAIVLAAIVPAPGPAR